MKENWKRGVTFLLGVCVGLGSAVLASNLSRDEVADTTGVVLSNTPSLEQVHLMNPARMDSAPRRDLEDPEVEIAQKGKLSDPLRALLARHRFPVLNFNALTLSEGIIGDFQLTPVEAEGVNTALRDTLNSLIEAEREHAHMESDEKGEQVLVIQAFDGSRIKSDLAQSLYKTLGSERGLLLLSMVEESALFGRFGHAAQRIYADYVQTNAPESMVNVVFHSDGIGGSDYYSTMVTEEVYVRRYGELVTSRQDGIE